MSKGGSRPGAGRKTRFKSGKCERINVPAPYASLLLEMADILDRGGSIAVVSPSDSGRISSSASDCRPESRAATTTPAEKRAQSNADCPDTVAGKPDAVIIKLEPSMLRRQQKDRRAYVHLDTLIDAGYFLPPAIHNQVQADRAAREARSDGEQS